MSYVFTPLTDEQIDTMSLLPDGNYNFEIIKSTHKTSKSGNPMAEIQHKIWDKEGKTHIIFDFLVFSTVTLNIKKVKHFCEAVGLLEEYKTGSLRENLDGLSGKLTIGIQAEQPKPSGGFYPKKNYVVDYVIEKNGPKKEEDFFEDAIPF